MKRKNVHIPEKLDKEIKDIAESKGVKAAEVHRRALELGVKIIKKES